MRSAAGDRDNNAIGGCIESGETRAPATAGTLLLADKARVQQQASPGPVGQCKGVLAALGDRLPPAWY